MTPEQLEVIGLPEDATDEQISERLTALAAAEQNPGEDDTPDPDEGGEDDPGKPEPGTVEPTPETPDGEKTDATTLTAKVPAGTVLVDAAALDSLKASASRADQLFEEKRVRDRAALLNAAIKDGKIAPARLAHWQAQYDVDAEGITKIVNELPSVIPVQEIGHGGSGDEGGEDATAYPTNYLTPAEKARIKQAQEA
jgi:Mu-like prophage I protein